MARPTTPLMTKRSVLQAALDIIDEGGHEALSIRRLGEELGVNGTSVYHYFASKDDILLGAAQLALESVARVPDEGRGWREWLPETVRRYRDVLTRHPSIIPIVLRRQEFGVASEALDANAARLMDEGVAPEVIVPLLDGLEYLALGSAMHANSTRDVPRAEASLGRLPALSRATKAATLSPDQVFDLAVHSMIDAIEAGATPAPRS